MKHQLILFYGSSPGAGKSTLSSQLNQQLIRRGIAVQWIYEDDVLYLAHFVPVVECVQKGGGPELLDACLESTERLVNACAGTSKVVVTDSVLPYSDWLMAATIDDLSIAEFNQKLWQLVEPMAPLLIYLKADVGTALKRAVAYRGEAWLERSIDFMNTWGANQSKPLRDLADVVAYDQQTDQMKQQLLSNWPGEVLWLDSVSMSLDECVRSMLNSLKLDPLGSDSPREEETVQAQDLDSYVGQYRSDDDELPHGQHMITVSIRDGDLWADIYWPNGCRLVAEGKGIFLLQNTSHWLAFAKTNDESSVYIHYHCRGKVFTYK